MASDVEVPVVLLTDGVLGSIKFNGVGSEAHFRNVNVVDMTNGVGDFHEYVNDSRRHTCDIELRNEFIHVSLCDWFLHNGLPDCAKEFIYRNFGERRIIILLSVGLTDVLYVCFCYFCCEFVSLLNFYFIF